MLPIGIFLVRDTSGSAYVQLVLFLFIGLGVAAPLYNPVAMSSPMTQNTTGPALIDEILDEPEMPDTPSPKQMNGRDIEFRGVSFSYEEKTVLHDVSFTVPQGSVTALVGPSGGGKTTIANLMGNDSAPFDAVVSAARAARIHDVIETLPQGEESFLKIRQKRLTFNVLLCNIIAYSSITK